MEVLERVLAEILSCAETAIAALDKLSNAGILLKDGKEDYVEYMYWCWEKVSGKWQRMYRRFAYFRFEDGKVTKYAFYVANPGGFLAKMLQKEKEKLESVAKLRDVTEIED